MFVNITTEGIIMNTGKAIRKALIDNDKTQVWLAEQINMSKQGINLLCNKESAQLSILNEIASALDMSVADLIALGE